ncbi:hypothetical protein [Phytohabitans rumicis]|uniref:Uncharacterized protein n=1 Tax=Phytohabitans rumicis TaxID=1076125 RepID=A0A6V8L1S8_9ACTN|nr:hypothetical protein [Phytohabitans rumicis]GFJ88066.1 hypothetical protein Prum_017080 [Phytohabitans rumicis]
MVAAETVTVAEAEYVQAVSSTDTFTDRPVTSAAGGVASVVPVWPPPPPPLGAVDVPPVGVVPATGSVARPPIGRSASSGAVENVVETTSGRSARRAPGGAVAEPVPGGAGCWIAASARPIPGPDPPPMLATAAASGTSRAALAVTMATRRRDGPRELLSVAMVGAATGHGGVATARYGMYARREFIGTR